MFIFNKTNTYFTDVSEAYKINIRKERMFPLTNN